MSPFHFSLSVDFFPIVARGYWAYDRSSFHRSCRSNLVCHISLLPTHFGIHKRLTHTHILNQNRKKSCSKIYRRFHKVICVTTWHLLHACRFFIGRVLASSSLSFAIFIQFSFSISFILVSRPYFPKLNYSQSNSIHNITYPPRLYWIFFFCTSSNAWCWIQQDLKYFTAGEYMWLNRFIVEWTLRENTHTHTHVNIQWKNLPKKMKTKWKRKAQHPKTLSWRQRGQEEAKKRKNRLYQFWMLSFRERLYICNKIHSDCILSV